MGCSRLYTKREKKQTSSAPFIFLTTSMWSMQHSSTQPQFVSMLLHVTIDIINDQDTAHILFLLDQIVIKWLKGRIYNWLIWHLIQSSGRPGYHFFQYWLYYDWEPATKVREVWAWLIQLLNSCKLKTSGYWPIWYLKGRGGLVNGFSNIDYLCTVNQ